MRLTITRDVNGLAGSLICSSQFQSATSRLDLHRLVTGDRGQKMSRFDIARLRRIAANQHWSSSPVPSIIAIARRERCMI